MVPGFRETYTRRLTTAFVGLVVGWAGTNHLAAAGEEPTPGSKIEVSDFVTEAAGYRIEAGWGEGEPQALVFVEEPILTWSNPVRNNGRGAYFVWTLEGRPLVVGTIMTHPLVRDRTQRVIRHEFHSLAPGMVKAHFEDETVWSPTDAGLSWTRLEAPPADADKRRRFLQMKTLARGVTARALDEGETRELRLLPNPLLRYESPSGGVVDGALFAFVTGTDPEVLLLIEARAEDDGLDWYAACARQTSFELEVRFSDASTWTAPKLDDYTIPTGTFISLRMKILPAE